MKGFTYLWNVFYVICVFYILCLLKTIKKWWQWHVLKVGELLNRPNPAFSFLSMTTIHVNYISKYKSEVAGSNLAYCESLCMVVPCWWWGGCQLSLTEGTFPLLELYTTNFSGICTVYLTKELSSTKRSWDLRWKCNRKTTWFGDSLEPTRCYKFFHFYLQPVEGTVAFSLKRALLDSSSYLNKVFDPRHSWSLQRTLY